MWIEALMLVGHSSKDENSQEKLCFALERRGWEHLGDNCYRAAIREATDDSEIVKMAERDVKESVYVSGVGDYEAICLIREDPLSLGASGIPGEVGSGADAPW